MIFWRFSRLARVSWYFAITAPISPRGPNTKNEYIMREKNSPRVMSFMEIRTSMSRIRTAREKLSAVPWENMSIRTVFTLASSSPGSFGWPS